MRVLVVDDNEASADTLHWAVELMGYDVRSCHDGQSALRVAADFRPDVVLLDIGMPHMDGLEVGKALRAMPGLSGIKIIAQTGWGDSRTRRQTAEAGFDLHLVKPVNMDMLEDMLWLLRSNTGRLAA
ncbi:response regulator [Asticcacaulis sp. 201]|uniref:response regulator n=1 Tax=Asticcacaulis sp. 201 TaxID=3028787 RepID=UPI0029165B1F|nr:response regulator [Asticcacaulis sp. 201]MDV6331443.1 response regulator [Asticcacaulis sp. 201]